MRWIVQGTWSRNIQKSFAQHGYLLFITLIGAYVGLYTIQMGRHELLANRATFERSTFITMVSSGNRGSFIAAMKDFGRIQNMEVSIEPSLFKPWPWFFEKHRPNKIPLYLWAKFFLALCTSDMCGEPHEESKSFRINLFQADLHEAFFGTDRLSFIESINKLGLLSADALHTLESYRRNTSEIKNDGILKTPLKEYQSSIDLHNADLRYANLSKSYMYDVNLYEADLRGANLTDAGLAWTDLVKADLRWAELRGTNLHFASLHGADLREVKGLTQTQLDKACLDQTTKLPSGLTHPQPNEYCKLVNMAVRAKHQYGRKPNISSSSTDKK